MTGQQSSINKRRQRRADLEAPIQVRRIKDGLPIAPEQALTTNVSLAGVYFEIEHGQPYAPNDLVLTSVSIPAPLQRQFPFTRLAGRGRVVRVDMLPAEEAGKGGRQGVALEFSENVTALSAIRS